MIRAALYARYSSDQQSSASIADQQRICRERAAREGWQIEGAYEDAAISGASMILRPGIQRLLADAQAGKFDIVLAEALDRVSRDQADVATLFKHLQFARVPLVTLTEGEISELHVGLKGTMNALFLKDLAKKTHRGLRGRVEKGFSAGPNAYGYRIVRRLNSEGELVRGEREIDPAEALIVERIFREFASGKSPRAIARDLNADGIPGPKGSAWRDTGIRGDVRRGTGIINNELYAGVRVWNHKHYVKDPGTGKSVTRLNPETEWIRKAVPDLRIVCEDLWDAVKHQQEDIARRYTAVKEAAEARALHSKRRPAYLLSGLLECGVCGGTYAIVVGDRYGCTGHHRKRTCTNGRTSKRQTLERRALVGIADRLVSADKVKAAVAAYAAHMNRENRERGVQADADARALAKIDRAVAGIMAAIEDGLYQPTMKARMAELEREREEITARLAEAPHVIPDVHPGIAEIYKRKVAALTETLGDSDTRLDASSDIRSLVGKIILHPGDKRGEVRATLHGSLMGILDFVNDTPQPDQRRVITSVPPGSRGRRQEPFPLSPKSASAAAMRSLTDIHDEYDFLDGDDRYRLLIELGRTLEPMPDALKTDATLVRGCSASVWVYPVPQPSGALHFLADSNAAITKGIVALVLAAVQDKPAAEVAGMDVAAALAPFDLARQLSSNRTQGVPNMIALVQDTARRLAAG